MVTADELIARLKKATADEQREAIDQALLFAWCRDWISSRNCRRGGKMLDAEAYESAALMLVPEGWSGEIMWKSSGPSRSFVELSRWPTDKADCPADFEMDGYAQDYPELPTEPGNGRPLALAIAIAAIKARWNSEGK